MPGDELIAAVGQPNGDLDEFTIELSKNPPLTYANHGPTGHETHAQLIGQLIAGAATADILVLPEYGLASASRDLVIASLPGLGAVPRLVISGVSSGTDDDGYILNDAVMVVTTPAGDPRRGSARAPATGFVRVRPGDPQDRPPEGPSHAVQQGSLTVSNDRAPGRLCHLWRTSTGARLTDRAGHH